VDISPEYIKMCEKAKEIQGKWVPQPWDFIYNPNALDFDPDLERGDEHFWSILPRGIADGGVYGPYVEDGKVEDGRYANIIFLPRQDQLQDMVQDGSPFTIEEIFHEWFVEVGCKCEGSWAQHWLAFIMWNVHGKTWNGEDWVNNA
jgi:hypothetical protein